MHSKLIAKLELYGTHPIMLHWTNSFLSDITHKVRVGSSLSDVVPVISGVPQGSVLGPVLFIVFINDICSCTPVGATLKLYADDAKLYSVLTCNMSTANLQQHLYNIAMWSERQQLKLSVKKCAVMHMRPSRRDHLPPVVYYLHSTKSPTVDDFTDLGVTYDHHFSFSAHIDRIVTKASQRTRLILMCFSTRDPAVLMMAFNTYVRPILEYATVVWSPFEARYS